MSNVRAPVRTFALPATPSNAWSNEDIQLLRQLALDGSSLEIIARRLRRTRSAVRNKATMHGISLKQVKSMLHEISVQQHQATRSENSSQRQNDSGCEQPLEQQQTAYLDGPMKRRIGLFLGLLMCLLLAPALIPARAAEPQPINACELLTSAEISKAISLSVDAGRRQDDGLQQDGQYSSSCIWMIEPGKPVDRSAPMGGRRFVILNVQQWPEGRNLAGKFLQAFRDSADNGVIASKPTPRKFGDEALWWGDGLAVRRGDISFGVSVFMPTADGLRTSASEEKLAPLILRRLDKHSAI